MYIMYVHYIILAYIVYECVYIFMYTVLYILYSSIDKDFVASRRIHILRCKLSSPSHEGRDPLVFHDLAK